jgi:hypothetical protein
MDVAVLCAAPSVFRRRFVVGAIAGSLIALGADFLGSTSAILSLNPDFFRGFRADVLYPIGGYKRCLETSKGFGKMQNPSLQFFLHISLAVLLLEYHIPRYACE